jgi:hypothetical protein
VIGRCAVDDLNQAAGVWFVGQLVKQVVGRGKVQYWLHGDVEATICAEVGGAGHIWTT